MTNVIIQKISQNVLQKFDRLLNDDMSSSECTDMQLSLAQDAKILADYIIKRNNTITLNSAISVDK